ncbi:MAG: cytochrome c oxidase assembly protein, partial [Chloroflexota bacterium]
MALASPLESWSAHWLTAHMAQHMLLMLVAAPLLVISRPWIVGLVLLPVTLRKWALRARRWRWIGLFLSPLVAWVAHALALWVWHAPRFYEAALRSEPLHLLEHAMFFFTAGVFWQSLFPMYRSNRAQTGLVILLLFTFSLQSGLLGALITFTPTPWYTWYLTDHSAGALQDQQLAGLIMWIPGGFVYLAAALAVLAPLMRDEDSNAKDGGWSPAVGKISTG